LQVSALGGLDARRWQALGVDRAGHGLVGRHGEVLDIANPECADQERFGVTDTGLPRSMLPPEAHDRA
jgi:hypothetical protein